ncbi:hypothetical protein ACOMHN_058053 [Nucella lapillus]
MTRISVTGIAEGQDPQPSHGHGDPCGYSADQSLVCCRGGRRSTLIYDTEECCNGSPVGPNEICCDDIVPVTLTSPDHNSCCIGPDSLEGVTFSSRQHYCDFRTGIVAELPSRRRTRNRLSVIQDPASSSEDSSLDDSPSFQRLCRSGTDVRPSEGLRWLGEVVGCCGREAYFASRHTCCAGVLHDSPSEDTLCCFDTAYRRGDSGNPCLGQCGGLEFNSENQLCCQGIIHPSTSSHDYCCGGEKISSDTKLCCGGAALPTGDSPYGCCRDSVPYVRRYMRCEGSGQVTREARGRFQSSALCLRLPAWGRHWPTVRLHDGRAQLPQIEGRVTHVRKSQQGKVHVTLNPIQLIQSTASGGHASVNSTCLESRTLRLNVNLGAASCKRRCRGRPLRQYLRHNVLHVYFPLNDLSCDDPLVAVMNVSVESRKHLILFSSEE